MRESLPIGPLLLTVFTSILEVFLLCLAGYVLAWKGILDKKTQKQLNRLNVSLFTPSLLFSKVAFFLSPEKLRELWIIPIFFVIVTLVSMSVAFVLGWVFRLKKSQRSFAMAAAMFMNSNSLPIALMQSLVVTVHGLKWVQDDNKNAMLGRALTYLVLYSTLGMILRWSFGVRLLAQADDEVGQGEIRLPDDTENQGNSALGNGMDSDSSDTEAYLDSPPTHSHFKQFSGPGSASTSASGSQSQLHPSIIIDDTHTHNNVQTQTSPQSIAQTQPQLRPPAARRPSRFYNSFPNSPNQSYITLPGIQSEVPSREGSDAEYDSEYASDEETIHNTGINVTTASATGRAIGRRRATVQSALTHNASSSWLSSLKIKRRLHRSYVAFKDFMTVPLWAALASIIVALVRPLQHALEEHMQPVKGALTSAGNCSIPVTLIVLGAYFYKEGSAEGDQSKTGGQGVIAGGDGVNLSNGTRGSINGIADEPPVPVQKGKNLNGSSGMLFENVRDMLKDSRRHGNRINEDGDDEESRGLLAGDVDTETETIGRRGHHAKNDIVKVKKQRKQEIRDRPRPGETRTVVIAVLSRMIVTPMLLLPIMALSKYFDLHKVVDDPIFVLSNVLLVSSPPALTLAQITQAASGDAFERLISRTIFWAYCVVTPPATIGYVVLALLMTRL